MQETACDVPPVLAVEDGRGPGPPGGGGKVAGGEAGGVRPADEPAGFFPVDGLAAGEPAVEAGLLAGAHCEAGGVEPVQEHDGAAGQPAGQERLLPGGGFPVVAAAHAPDQVPDQVAVQDPAPFRVGPGVRQAVEECLEPGHLLVAPRQRAGGDEGLAQVGEGRALGQPVECLVGERDAAVGEAGQYWRYGQPGRPAHRGDRVLGAGDLAAQRLQAGRQRAGVGPRQLVQPGVDDAAGARAGAGMIRVAADRAACPGRRRSAAGAERAVQRAGGGRLMASAG